LRDKNRRNVSHLPYPVAKKAFDKTIAALLLVAAAPVAVVAVGLQLAGMLRHRRDWGPILYRERRISAGREFDLLKFRTLRRDAIERTRAAGSYARLAEADEANLTWAGRILKRWYLDELPQLLNVLAGSMSLVGPRPWPIQMVEAQRAEGLDYRDRIVAGWTGPVQIQKDSGVRARDTDVDLAYVEAVGTLSPLRLLAEDARVLVDTVRLLRRGQGLRF
jgi:lipopolysaccharide/colanic/teichoic acid biosynthesis glycosyltransferase